VTSSLAQLYLMAEYQFFKSKEFNMTKPSLILLGSFIASLVIFSPMVHAKTDCEAKAVSKEGKPLAGAAKTASIKKCESETAPAPTCADKAVDKNGKPLAGAAKTSFIKKCEADGK
jgi:hypothetical protein